MIQKISDTISVSMFYDCDNNRVFPKWLIWRKRLYPVSKVGLHHIYRKGNIMYHVFSIVSKNTFFKIVLNTQNLHWKLEEISDGFAD